MRILLFDKGITTMQFEADTGMSRRFLYKGYQRKLCRSTLMALAYYLGMTVEELVDGTDAMQYWYR